MLPNSNLTKYSYKRLQLEYVNMCSNFQKRARVTAHVENMSLPSPIE